MKIDRLLSTLHFSLNGETDVVDFCVQFADCPALMLAQIGNTVFRVTVHDLNDEFLETWHEQESANWRARNEPADAVGEHRELPCWACRNLVKIVAGQQELGMVFVAHKELVVREFCPLCCSCPSGAQSN